MPPNEAYIGFETVKIKSWNARENGNKEFEVDYDTILENLKQTKISFLVKNIFTEGDEPIQDDIEVAPENKLSTTAKGQKDPAEQKDNGIGIDQIQFKIPGGKDKEDEKEEQKVLKKPANAFPKGPKKKLTQIPQHSMEDDGLNASFDFDR